MDCKHIHIAKDGRGLRSVYCDGKKIDRVCYADLKKGFLYYYPKPYRVNRKRQMPYARELRGIIEVHFPERSHIVY